ncbi:GtrA family protein [Pantoea allii]|uniref:GtrA family protein n=1 Tax=Pantoea allii TaxID=574096 RepID=UPI003977C44B
MEDNLIITKIPSSIRNALYFIILSGLGWCIDLIVYSTLVVIFKVSAAPANFLSSYAGLTFVWFTSLKYVFNKKTNKQSTFLLLFWSWQFLSIIVASKAVEHLSSYLNAYSFLTNVNTDIVAKIAVTPVTLLCNYLFMRFLTSKM